ncbi:serine/threonine-protein kinase PRP4 homolog [Malaya genurostris]|uniref:serine/threonine-protein kinase PRP4 homolog n=1 Tax=Malaya genurostris TaxID=325434 RepID=UPI0026F3AFE2|nr:serine/threonine-protein kinase PRP4 homolog [Malaya genurostris]
MSFLRSIRNNLTNNNYNAQRNGKSKSSKPSSRSIVNERSSSGRPNSSDRTLITSESEQDRPGYGTYASRRNSGIGSGRRGSNSATLRREDKYGKENPAPIIVFVDNYDTAPKPAGILRKNTFTKHDREHEQRRTGNAISRSDTFTINESDDEQKTKTNTYSKKKQKEHVSHEYTTDSPGAKKHEPSEKLPTVIDSNTYRKKSLKSSKPVQKVESFIRRFEKSLFKHDSKKTGRKDSNSSIETYVPKFRDIGINCKLDDEEKLKTRKKRQGSRDSLLEKTNIEHSSSSQRSYHERSATPRNRQRERSSSPTKKYSTVERHQKEKKEPTSVVHIRERSHSPFETLELKKNPTDNSYLKMRQKEIEMGYSTVNKNPSSTLTRTRSPDRNKSILINTTRKERYDPESSRSYTVTTSTHRVEYDRPSPFRSDTYNTLKEEYEQANHKPVGIASPRLSSDRSKHDSKPSSPTKENRKDSGELPKYTFGTNLQERRSRFQQFQKSFQKMGDNSTETSYQQSFFIPI